MAKNGRENVRGKGGVRFKAGFDAQKKESMLRNIVTEFIIHEKIMVTSGILKEFKCCVDKLITYAKKKKWQLANSFLRPEKDNKGKRAIDKLFGELSERFKNRNGGYTKSYNYITRKGDGAKQVIVVFSEPDQVQKDNNNEAILK